MGERGRGGWSVLRDAVILHLAESFPILHCRRVLIMPRPSRRGSESEGEANTQMKILYKKYEFRRY